MVVLTDQTIFDVFFLSLSELLYCLRRLQQLALEVFPLVSPQGADARVGLLAALAFGRLLVRVVVVSVVLLDVFELLLRFSLMVFSVSFSIYIDISAVH